jgi:hypothetical protein
LFGSLFRVPYPTTNVNAFGVAVYVPATSGSTNDFYITAQQGVTDAIQFGVYGPALNCFVGDQLVGWGTGNAQQVNRLTMTADQASNMGKGLLYIAAIDKQFSDGVIRGQVLPIADAQTLPDCVWVTPAAPANSTPDS